MPRLVQKSGYIRAGDAGGYMKYIATREGVEKLHGTGPPTQKQVQLIQKLLKDFPDSKELFEYADYIPHQLWRALLHSLLWRSMQTSTRCSRAMDI